MGREALTSLCLDGKKQDYLSHFPPSSLFSPFPPSRPLLNLRESSSPPPSPQGSTSAPSILSLHHRYDLHVCFSPLQTSDFFIVLSQLLRVLVHVKGKQRPPPLPLSQFDSLFLPCFYSNSFFSLSLVLLLFRILYRHYSLSSAFNHFLPPSAVSDLPSPSLSEAL